MEPSLIDIARKVVDETCRDVDLTFDNAFFVSILDDSITVSIDINTVKGGAECILYLPSISLNTVGGSNPITFANKCRELIHIDKKGEVHNVFVKDGLSIWCNILSSNLYGCNARLCLSYGNNPLFDTRIDKEEDFQKLWEYFLLAHKVIVVKEDVFNIERVELNTKIEELNRKYIELEKKHKSMMDSIKGIINETLDYNI